MGHCRLARQGERLFTPKKVKRTTPPHAPGRGARRGARARKGDERLIRTQLQNNAQKILSCYNHA